MKRTLASLLFCFTIGIFVFPLDAIAQDKEHETKRVVLPWAKRRIIEEDSQRKDDVIDSLLDLINEYQIQLEEENQKRQELIEFYDNKEKNKVSGIGIPLNEYDADVTDSLLNIWYVHKTLRENKEGEEYDMESVSFASNVPDSVYMARIKQMNSFITLPYNETVRNYIILYSEKMPTKMKQMLGLAKFYMPIFEETFNRYGLPEELKYMSIIESALNPTAFSRAGAAGMWQFMHATGKSYGLQINSFVDERYDVVKAADAAARYLRDAYDIFGDWSLAISSYNCGAGNVNKAIRRSGSREFWDLYPYLPRETRGYVPAFVGAMYAFEFHKEHGLVPDNVAMPAHVDTFEVKKMLHFKQINEVVGIPIETLKNLNPQYTHQIIPGTEQTYILQIPHNYTANFIEHEDSVYKHKSQELFNPTVLDNIKNYGSADSERITYRVKKGDYLGKIAARYHVSVSNIKKWNNLRSNNISIGQRLTIYQKSSKPASSQSTKTTTTTSTTATQEKAKADTAKAVTKVDSSKTVTAIDSLANAADTLVNASDSLILQKDSLATAKDSLAVSNDKNNNVTESISQEQEKTNEVEVAEEKEPEVKEIIYTVKKGDTLYEIARKYPGVTVKEIMSLNGVSSNIRPGMKLKIPVK